MTDLLPPPFASTSNDGAASKIQWKVLTTLSGLAAAFVTRAVLNRIWTRVSPSDHDPPLNAADRRIGWGEALTWSVAAGVGVGVSRVVSDRLAATVWQIAKDEPPPGIES